MPRFGFVSYLSQTNATFATLLVRGVPSVERALSNSPRLEIESKTSPRIREIFAINRSWKRCNKFSVEKFIKNKINTLYHTSALTQIENAISREKHGSNSYISRVSILYIGLLALLIFYCYISSRCHSYLHICDRGFIRGVSWSGKKVFFFAEASYKSHFYR